MDACALLHTIVFLYTECFTYYITVTWVNFFVLKCLFFLYVANAIAVQSYVGFIIICIWYFSGFSYEPLSPSPSSDIYSWRSGGRSPTPSPPLSEGGSGSSIWGQNTTDEGIVIDEFDDILPRKKRVSFLSPFRVAVYLSDRNGRLRIRTKRKKNYRELHYVAGNCLLGLDCVFFGIIKKKKVVTLPKPTVNALHSRPAYIGTSTGDVWPKCETNIRIFKCWSSKDVLFSFLFF